MDSEQQATGTRPPKKKSAGAKRRTLTILVTLGRWIRCWWLKLMSTPIDALIILAFVVGVLVVLTELTLRIVEPEAVLVVAPFEVPATLPGPLAVTGKTLGNLVVDQMQRMTNEAARYLKEAAVTAGAPKQPESVGLEVGGISVEGTLAWLEKLRQKQHVVGGDLLLGPEGGTLLGRMDGRFGWTVGPFPANAKGLEAASHDLALKIMSRSNPEVAGLVYQKQGDLDGAIDAFNFWLSRNTDDRVEKPRAYFRLGVAYDLKGDPKQALANYEKSLALKPNFPEVLTNLGFLYYQQHELEKSIKNLQQSRSLKPNDVVTLLDLGNAYLDTGRYPEAIEAYQEARGLAPDISEIRYNLAIALSKAGRLEEAEHERNEAQHVRSKERTGPSNAVPQGQKLQR